jgi:hypothetical protein
LLGTNTSFAAANRTAVASGSEWDVLGDPILDVQTAIEASAQEVTSIWMNKKIAHTFLRHDAVRDHMRQMMGDGAANSAITSVANAGVNDVNTDFVIPGFPPFRVVAGKVKNESTAALDWILSDVVVLTSAPPGVPTDGEEIATTYTFRRKGPSGTGFSAREYFLENRGPEGGTMIVVAQADIAVITGNNCGGIITNVHS